jgi:hypothetical protein
MYPNTPKEWARLGYTPDAIECIFYRDERKEDANQ